MISYLANPRRFLGFEKWAAPIAAVLAIICLALGTWMSLFTSPADETQGEVARIMYVHVPAAWAAMMAYTALTIASLISFVWRHNLADYGAKAFARLGAVFTFLALVTGSIWGKPTWGTWWEWDGRMTSVLVLFFIYIGYLSIWGLVDDKKRAARLASIVAMVGFVNIPIIKFSVEWWNSLHQPATISNIGSPGLPPEFLWPLGLMALGYTALFAWLAMVQVKTDILSQKRQRDTMKPSATIQVDTL